MFHPLRIDLICFLKRLHIDTSKYHPRNFYVRVNIDTYSIHITPSTKFIPIHVDPLKYLEVWNTDRPPIDEDQVNLLRWNDVLRREYLAQNCNISSVLCILKYNK